MHGRQAMLACVGLIWPSTVGKLNVPWAENVSSNPFVAQYELPSEVVVQVGVSIFIAEGLRSRIVFGGGENYVPGDHGFDPLNFIQTFCNTEEKMFDMKTKETLNGRLAMIAFLGMSFQLAITGTIWPFF
jgi:hypothetical protein